MPVTGGPLVARFRCSIAPIGLFFVAGHNAYVMGADAKGHFPPPDGRGKAERAAMSHVRQVWSTGAVCGAGAIVMFRALKSCYWVAGWSHQRRQSRGR